jgi:DNA topoisomerase II
VEPNYYLPIIPMCLVNGCEGIGTGWSTFLPNYNPLQLISQLKSKLSGADFESLSPWYKGFRGSISEDGKGGYFAEGVVEVEDEIVEVRELPIGKWTRDYKEFLEGLEDIADVKELHTNN